ncbi:hypothetical protein [Paraflavitalea speifideaquila]|uniref:hypothetical protein n=1 Tax=Paraflavitalea speifideaquila TaxID=3076558 RepID=UPI0028ED0487|nr:hypothetical protein [Paraflavitalea speifideiaquila]
MLDSTERKLEGLRSSMKTLITDTVLRQLFRDSVLRQQFSGPLKDMRENWRSSTRHLRESLATINLLQTQNSSNAITTARLLENVNTMLNTSAARVLEKNTTIYGRKTKTACRPAYGLPLVKCMKGNRKPCIIILKTAGINGSFYSSLASSFYLDLPQHTCAEAPAGHVGHSGPGF